VKAKDTIQDGSGQRLERLSVAQAARALGVTESGVRKRVSRGTLPHERDENGTVWVYVDPLQTVSGTPLDSPADEVRETVLDALHDQVATLKDQVRYLQSEGERKDAIIMTLAQRVPELEASPQATGASVTPSENGEGSTGPDGQDGAEKPSWFRRFFGLHGA
jgi:hypothetical protein